MTRRLAVALAAALAFGGLLQGGWSASAQTAPVEPLPVTIDIEATRDILVAQSSPWLDAMAESELASVSYRSLSSATARGHLLSGAIDGAVVGSPFTPAELATKPDFKTIAIPFHVSTAMLLMSEPYPDGFEQQVLVSPDENPICDPSGDDFDPAVCVKRTKVTGPIRIPSANLVAMLFGVKADGLATWRHADVRAALGAPDLNLGNSAAPTVIHREPGESVNLHLQSYAVTSAPAVWDKAKMENPERTYEVDEGIPGALTRSTPTFQAQQVGLWQTDPRTGGVTANLWAGNMAAVPPAAKLEVQEVFPTTPLRVVEVRNGAGEWVAPTPATISKAVEVGGATPIAAVAQSISGAYPLVWVDHLNVSAGGLSPETANATAAFVRYVVTAGQETASTLGEGRLSTVLVAQALKGADEIVEKNCTATGFEVVRNSKPGPYAPPALAGAGIAEMAHCLPEGAGRFRSTATVAPTRPTPSTTVARTTRAAPVSTVAASVPSTTVAVPPTPTTIASSEPLPTTTPSTVAAIQKIVTAATSSPARPKATTVRRATPPTTSAKPALSRSRSIGSPDAAQLAAAPSSRFSAFPRPAALLGRLDSFATLMFGAGVYLVGRRLYLRRQAGPSA